MLLPIRMLLPADSPRSQGIDEKHVQDLAEILPTLPPILVNRATMRVVDGMHRVAAATLLGHDTVAARFFDGDPDESFLRSVVDNVTRGLPLSVADRKAAALRILKARPELSNRTIATQVGLDSKTIAAARRSAGESPQPNSRLGSDGRLHPLNRTSERIRAAELMSRQPYLPLRAVVEQTGLSLGTAHDVRKRLLRGESPVPGPRRRPDSDDSAGQPHGTPSPPSPDRQTPDSTPNGVGPPAGPAETPVPADPAAAAASPPLSTPAAIRHHRTSAEALRRLAADPSIRHTEAGRRLLQWLHAHVLLDDSWQRHVDAVPAHRISTIADAALQCSRIWKRFAEELARRKFSGPPTEVDE
ncbi:MULTISPECIES: ParB/RepB/Spo0J family partition protein [unclassified Streptomyces]|uniref:ParB/RepB/Spo0J family partition protein n=1 Tax=unclassified Streptomyces TaxID=2593676 RepID=UPI0021562C85|nr:MULTISPECIES: ParB/RepB/Spo0J family partition protein [unclassified Streptomyces]